LHISILAVSYYSNSVYTDPPSFPTRRSSDLRVRAVSEQRRRRRGRLAEGTAGLPPLLAGRRAGRPRQQLRQSEEHTSELQSRFDLVCRLLLEKKKKKKNEQQQKHYIRLIQQL